MSELELLNEDMLREVVGADEIGQAYAELSMGRPVQRQFHLDGMITASWTMQPGSPRMSAQIQDDNLMVGCSCAQFAQSGSCPHVVGMLLAWATQRDSFMLVQEELTEVVLDEPPQGRPRLPSRPREDPVKAYAEILNQFTVSELREIARLRNVPVSGIRKDPIVETLAEALLDPIKLREDWPRLSAPARLVGGLLPFLGNSEYLSTLQKAAQALGVNEKAFSQAVDELKSFGLLFVTPHGHLEYPRLLPLILPPDPDFLQVQTIDVKTLRLQAAPPPRAFSQSVTRLLILLQAAADLYKAWVDPQMEEVQKSIPFLGGWPVDPEYAKKLARDANTFRQVERDGLPTAPAPAPVSPEAGRKLAAELQVEPGQVDFLIRLLSSSDLGLVKVKPGKPLRPAQEAVTKVAQLDGMASAQEWFTRYINMDNWSELDLAMARPGGLRYRLRSYYGNYSAFLDSLSLLRERLLLVLRRLPAGQWYGVEALAKRAGILLMPVLQGTFTSGFFEVSGRKIQLGPGDSGPGVMAYLLEAVLSGPLFWQGIVDLAWNQNQLAGFRLTGLGASLLGQPVNFAMPEPQGAQPALAFSERGELLLNLETASSSLVGLLVLLGDVEVSQQGQIIIRPTLAGVGRAFETGWNPNLILAAIKAEASQPIPTALEKTLQKWWQDFGSVQLYQEVALLEFNDDYALNELLAGTSLARHLLYRFSPRLVAIRAEGAGELREEMIKKGYTPKTAA